MAKTGDYILVHFTQDHPAGFTFERRRLSWPLHITLIVWFRLPADVDYGTLDRKLAKVADNVLPYDLTVGGVKHFGPRKDVAVNIISNQEPVRELHKKLKISLDELPVTYQSERWAGDDFSAHITQHDDVAVPEGTVLHTKDFYLLRLLPGNICAVVKTYQLGYNT